MYPYTQNTGSLTGLIKAIGRHGVPAKFTVKELPIWGYKSSNDRSVVSVLKALGFLDGGGVPTDLWKEARTHPENATARGVRQCYADLFQTFPDANRKDSESLTNYFKAKTTVGDAVVKQIIGTFKALVAIANFDDEANNSIQAAEPSTVADRTAQHHMPLAGVVPSSGMTVNLNIELALPVDASGEVYDKFFAAMKKYLINDA